MRILENNNFSKKSFQAGHKEHNGMAMPAAPSYLSAQAAIARRTGRFRDRWHLVILDQKRQVFLDGAVCGRGQRLDSRGTIAAADNSTAKSSLIDG